MASTPTLVSPSQPKDGKLEAETEAGRLDQRLKVPIPANAKLKITDTDTPGVSDGNASDGFRNKRQGEPARIKKPEKGDSSVPHGHQPEFKNPAVGVSAQESPQNPEIRRSALRTLVEKVMEVNWEAIPFPLEDHRGIPTNDKRPAGNQSKAAKLGSAKLLPVKLEDLSKLPSFISPIVDIVAVYNFRQPIKVPRADTSRNPPASQTAGLVKKPEVPPHSGAREPAVITLPLAQVDKEVTTDAASMAKAKEVDRARTTLPGGTYATWTAKGKGPDNPKPATNDAGDTHAAVLMAGGEGRVDDGQDIVAPSGKDNEAGVSDWLIDKTMLANELGRSARVLVFPYEFELKEHSAADQPEPSSSCLQDTAEALLSELKADKGSAKVPLVFIATGFGCFVVEKMIALLGTLVQKAAGSPTESKLESHSGPGNQPAVDRTAEAEENSKLLKRIATVIFLEDPNHTTVLNQTPDKASQEAAKTGPEIGQGQGPKDIPPIHNPKKVFGLNFRGNNKTDREKAGGARYIALNLPLTKSPRTSQDDLLLRLREFNSWSLWGQFKEAVEEHELSAVCFYTTAPDENPQPAAVTFIKPELGRGRDSHNRSPSGPRGPGSAHYIQIVHHIKHSLVLKASDNKDFKETLQKCIHSNYDLHVWDHNHRYPIHRAAHKANGPALISIMKTNPNTLLLKDNAGSTPLHLLIQTAIKARPDEEISALKMTIHNMLSLWAEAMPEHDTDTLLDFARRSPWDYVPTRDGDCDPSHCWIRELKEAAYPVGSAKASSSEIIDREVKLSNAEKEACRKTKASLIQFYVEEQGGKQDFWARYRPDVFRVIYDPDDGIDKLFDRKLGAEHETRLSATCRWIHLPANNEQWVHDLFGRRLWRVDYSTRDRRFIGRAAFDRHIVPGAYRYGQGYQPSSPEAQGPDHITDGSGGNEKSVTALFIPVLGFETSANREKLTLAIKSEAENELATQETPGSPTGEIPPLISAYLNNDQFPLHCRRTLDQFTYHMLKDTERRDKTQVMFKQHRREIAKDDEKAKQNSPVIMIDQLWLWVLEDERTVITSLPNTWTAAENYNLVEHLLRKELKGHPSDRSLDRPMIGAENSMDLANAIIRGSVSFLERVGPSNTKLEESFQSSITMIAERQAEQFESFKKLVKRLNRVGSDEKKRAILTNKLFQVTVETTLLMEIMDIEDELNTIKRVLLQQWDALKNFAQLLFADHQKSQGKGEEKTAKIIEPLNDAFWPSDNDADYLESQGRKRKRKRYVSPLRKKTEDGPVIGNGVHVLSADDQERNETMPPDGYRNREQTWKTWNLAKANLDVVQSNLAKINEIARHAKRIRGEINALLSHRQKQANAWEARFAREGSEYTQRQSSIMLVFTIVTVFFLPLSFMSSVFAIQIDAFPHDPTSGELNWPLKLVMGLLFGISAVVILIVLFLGLCITRKWSSVFRVRAATSMIFSEVNPREDCDSDTNPDSESDDPISTAGVGARKKPHKAPPTGYALLFNKWAINSRIPFIRLLWKQRPYKYSLVPKHASSSPKPSESGKQGKQSKPVYPVDRFQPRSVVDYPLRRARLLAKMLVKDGIVWMRLKLASLWRLEKRSDGDYKVDGSANREAESSMRRHGSDPATAAADRRLLTLPSGTRLPAWFGSPLEPLEPRLQKRKGHNAHSLVPGLVPGPGGVRGGVGSEHQRSGWDRMGDRSPSSGWPFWRRRKSMAEDTERGIGVEQEPGGASTSLERGGRKSRERV